MLKLFLAGDVMTGRGVDQILPHPNAPHLYEPWARSALDYVDLAERRNGPIARPVDFAYVWGAALGELEREQPAARIINLETAVTSSEDAVPGKGIHYRMHPANAAVLDAAGIDCCTLANNHVLDWGEAGLVETLDTLRRHGIKVAGAGGEPAMAAAPAVIGVGDARRVLVFAFCTSDSGVPPEFAATGRNAGVNLLPDLSARTAAAIAQQVSSSRRAGDTVIASIHWGGNWGYQVSAAEQEFAHRLIDEAQVDIVYGHSSHHAKGIEVYRRKLILYGCGDLLNDYEGIGGHEQFRPDVALMYFPTLDSDGALAELVLVPLQLRRFRLEPAQVESQQWMLAMLNHEGRTYGSRFEQLEPGARGRLRWHPATKQEATGTAQGG